MGIAKVVEVNSSSTKSFEDAIQTGIAKVTETVKKCIRRLGKRAKSGG